MIRLKDKTFKEYISATQIREVIHDLAKEMTADLKDSNPLFLAVLNGSFIFAADLFREFEFDCEICFVKLASYSGTTSKGKVDNVIGLNKDINGRTVVVLEDIVDTGDTVAHLLDILTQHEPRAVKFATLLYKPETYKKNIKLDYVGIKVPADFLIGYGLDYDGLGRNLKGIYVLTK